MGPPSPLPPSQWCRVVKRSPGSGAGRPLRNPLQGPEQSPSPSSCTRASGPHCPSSRFTHRSALCSSRPPLGVQSPGAPVSAGCGPAQRRVRGAPQHRCGSVRQRAEGLRITIGGALQAFCPSSSRLNVTSCFACDVPLDGTAPAV